MDEKFESYLNLLGVSDFVKKELETGYFQSYGLTNANMVFKAEVVFPHFIKSYRAFEEFLNICNDFAKTPNGFYSSLTFKFIHPPLESDLKVFINDYIDFYKYDFLKNYIIKLDSKEITFEYTSSLAAESLKLQVEKLVNILKILNCSLKVCLGYINNSINQSTQIDREFQKDSIKQSEINNIQKEEAKKQYILDRTYIPCKIKDAITLTLKRVEVIGDIFNVEIRDIKDHTKKLAVISYSDGTYAVISTIFENKRYTAEFLTSLEVGQRVKIKGQPMYDDFAKQVAIRVDNIEVVEKEALRMDDYPGRKRIELHLHTQMSTMDATGNISDYVNTMKRWGWEAIGVCDHGGVQVFPALQDKTIDPKTKKPTIKPLFGAELYMVDSELKVAFNPSDVLLSNSEYVVFDLETTGLSSRYDRIIEFGAVKVKEGQILDQVDFFINPDMPLAEVTKNLTHITDEQVRSGKSIKKALLDIKEFIKDSILVAHNAVFDFGFLNEALINNGFEELKNPVIDTLPLSRFLYSDLRSHTLGSICKKLGVVYDEDTAHRANYDAEVLKGCWDAMENMLTNMKSKIEHRDLNNLFSLIKDENKAKELEITLIKNTPHPYHVVCYAKDKQGLKDLFQLISDSCITYFKDVPRVPKKELSKLREHLIIGSACFNGEVYQSAMTRSKKITKKVMEFYDYIEVQPLTNYSFLINDGQLTSFEASKKIVIDIIEMAKELDKIICATSDCHYIEKEDKKYRDIYIYAKGLKGARHPLNPYRRSKMPYYENPDQYLRTTQEMLDEFKFLNDDEFVKKIVIDNPHLIADQISDEIRPIHSGLSAPTIDNCDVLLKELVYKTAKDMYGDPLPKIVSDRLEAEMSGISANHYEVIYWIASKLVRQANKDGYIVGSRGSVGSSLVATMSGITEVNPLQPHYRCPKCKHSEWLEPDEKIRSGFDLPEKECPCCHINMIHDGQNIPFATFIGFHAEKTPDIDLNFPPDYQPHAHELTKTLLTKESGNHVYKAGTIGSVEEKIAIGYVKGYFETLEQFYPEMNVKADEISNAEINYLAKGCIGVKRTTGQHPGGIIVIPRGMDVTDFTPIQYPADDPSSSWQTSHFDFNSMHDTILKLDLLGHVDPMALRMMSMLSNKNIYEIPFNDKDVMSLFTSPDALKMKHNYLGMKVGTQGMPEFGTQFAMNMLIETQPKCFADLVIISGLSHGTDVYAGNQQNLIREGITNLQGVIGCRDDIMMNLHNYYGLPLEDTFQIMEITRHGKFNPTVAKSYEKYVKYTQMMKDHHVPDYFIESCNKIKYLFPKGHAVAYVMMCVRVGWFKVHDPLSFYATYFTCRADQFDIKTMINGERAVLNKLNELEQIKQVNKKLGNTEEDLKLVLQMSLEMLDRGFKFSNIDIYKSDATKFVIDRENNSLIPPFTSLSGVGESAALSVIEARKNGPFISVSDFIKRTNITSKKVDELKEMGCFKDLPDSNLISLF